MFRTVPLSIIRSSLLYTQQWYMSYRFADSLRAGSERNRPDPDHVEFYSKRKFEKLVHLVGFIIKNYHDARSPERQTTYLPHFLLRHPKLANNTTATGCATQTYFRGEFTCRTTKLDTFTQF